MQFPVLRQRMVRMMSGTEIAYGARRCPACEQCLAAEEDLKPCDGPLSPYGLATRWPVLTYRMVLSPTASLPDVRY
eukprot:3941923-Rhodomonas_salina.3